MTHKSEGETPTSKEVYDALKKHDEEKNEILKKFMQYGIAADQYAGTMNPDQKKSFFDSIKEIPLRKPYRVSFEDYIMAYLHWSRDTFSESTPVSSLRHLHEEIDEVISELYKNSAQGIPICKTQELLEEYIDCLMCLLNSASFAGYSTKEIVTAFKLNMDKNMARKWKKNSDNTYSHES